jgi:toxoflavin synthase
MTNQFDSLSSVYEDFSGLAFRKYLEFPTVLSLIGDPAGLRVLHFGCGTGVYCRCLARAGARQVVGTDVSAGMLAYAAEQERQSSQGIEYISGDLPRELAGTFDLVLSVYVLPYAATRTELDAQIRAAANALRRGGRYIALPINPAYDGHPDYYARYGFRLYSSGPRIDGAPTTLELRFGDHGERVNARYWTASTLEKSLRQGGFTAITWQRHKVSEEGIAAWGAGFWKPYLEKPHAAVLDCTI